MVLPVEYAWLEPVLIAAVVVFVIDLVGNELPHVLLEAADIDSALSHFNPAPFSRGDFTTAAKAQGIRETPCLLCLRRFMEGRPKPARLERG